MAVSKPTPGQEDWDLPLNNALDALDGRITQTETVAEDAATVVGAHEGRIQQLEASNVQGQIGDAVNAANRAEVAAEQAVNAARSVLVVTGSTSVDIQAALDSLEPYVVGEPKRHVQLAAGDWTINSPVRIPSGVLFDMRLGARLTLANGVNGDVLTNKDWATGNTDIDIFGGYLNGNRTNQISAVGDGPGQSLVSMVNVTRCKISGVEGTSPFLHGVDLAVRDIAANSFSDPGCSDAIIENCRFTDFGDDGITSHWSRGISIVACENYSGAASYSGSSNGIEIDDGSSDVTISACVVHHCANGVMVQGHAGRVPARRVTVAGLVAHNLSRAALQVAQPTAAHGSEAARGVTCHGLIVKDCYAGVEVTNYRNVQVRGCHWENLTNAIIINESVASTVTNINISDGEMATVSANKVVYTGTATSKVLTTNLVGGVFSDEIWIPAERLLAQAGSPVTQAVGPAGRELACWMLDAAADESLSAIIPLPKEWVWGHAFVYWMNPNASSGNVVLQLNRSVVPTGSTVSSESAGTVTTAAAGSQHVITSTQVMNNTPVDPSNLLRVELNRLGSNGSDTLANDIAVVGVMLRRAA